MKNIYFLLPIMTSLLLFSCSKNDEDLNLNEELNPEIKVDCVDLSSIDPINLVVDRSDWFANTLVEQHFMVFQDEKKVDLFLPNCNLEGRSKTDVYEYECNGENYVLEYDYEYVQYVSGGVGNGNFVAMGGNVYYSPIYNQSTAEFDHQVHVSLNGNWPEARIDLIVKPDGSIDCENCTLVPSITINNVIFENAIIAGSDPEMTNAVATQEHGMVAVKSDLGNWYTFKE